MEEKNTCLVCVDCLQERKNFTQANLLKIVALCNDLDISYELYFKFDFTEEIDNKVEHEHMFVKVLDINLDNKEVIGKLANGPVILQNVSFEDMVTFNIDDIEEIQIYDSSNRKMVDWVTILEERGLLVDGDIGNNGLSCKES